VRFTRQIQKKTDEVNLYFSSINTVNNNVMPDFAVGRRDSNKLEDVHFTPSILVKVCKKIRPKLTTDPDGYPPILLKNIISAVAMPLYVLFQSSMSLGKVPASWHNAIITPLFKNGFGSG